MIQLHITRTSKGYNEPQGEYRTYDNSTKEFKNMAEAKAFLADRYFYNKTRHPIYKDGKDGNPKRVGWIYSFKGDGDRRYDEPNWLGQDWVTFSKVTRTDITV